MTPKERQHRFRVFLAFGLVYFFWGSTYIGIRIAVEHIPPALLSAMRFVAAGLFLLAYCAFSGRRIRLTVKDALLLLVMGVLLLTGGNMMLAYSEQYLPSGLAALIVAVVPERPRLDRLGPRSRGPDRFAVAAACACHQAWLAPEFIGQDVSLQQRRAHGGKLVLERGLNYLAQDAAHR
ncbi:MAG: hypothetical protein DMG67_01045 [Acidobacteria bacterium]|nr:MAG: hypothetical protein DMG67_01045 [Acidobacteriota bacterium]